MKAFSKKSLLCLLLVSVAAFANADTLTWDGGASGSFSTGPWTSDGSHTTPENGDTLVFGTVGDFNNDIADLSVAGISITASGAVRINGSQITLAGGGSLAKSGSGVYTNNVPLVLGTAAGQTVYVEVASGCTIEMSASMSGAANLVYGNTSTTAGAVNLRADSDYTGTTTIKRGKIRVYANDALGSSVAGTTFQNATKDDGNTGLFFYSVTVAENVTVKPNYGTNANSSTKPVQFNGNCTFSGTWTLSDASGGGRIYFTNGSTVHFTGKFSTATWFTHALFQGTAYFDGEGSSFGGDDDFYGGAIYYNAHCKCPKTMSIGQSNSSGWLNMTQTRYFNCENATVYNNSTPPVISFIRGGCAADMCGYDQTFQVITCASGNSSSVVRSTNPSTIHLTLPGTSAATCYAKFTGQVSLSFEGSRPISLGNTANTSTGSLSLTNAAAVTLLDGFKWSGSSVTVADGSTLAVGGITLPTETVVAIRDRSDSARSVVSLNAGVDLSVSGLSINGANMALGKTYGATGSGADVIDDDHFAGTGVLRVLAGTPLTLTWNGGSSGTLSSASWSGGSGGHVTPIYGDTLVFPIGGVFENDIADLTVAGISVTASDAVTLSGSQIAIANGGSISKSGSGVYTNNVPLVLGTAATPAVNIDVAASCSLVMNVAVSGPADIVYNNASTSTGTVNLRNDGSDYTGATTARRGVVNVYSDDAFGSTDGATTLSGAANNALKVYFRGVTMDENFTAVNNATDDPDNWGNYPIQFSGPNTFGGTWGISGNGYMYFTGSNTFNGVVSCAKTRFFSQATAATLAFNGEGSSFSDDIVYGGTISYGAKCQYNGTLTTGRTTTKGWINIANRRNFDCEDAILHDPAAPAALAFGRVGCTADMRGYDQTFSVITCDSGYSSCVVTSTGNPSAIHLTLPGTSAATCYAKFTGQVSLSFEGSRPYSLGNTANTSTGSLSLTNAAAVTLLDGFAWVGSSVTVADGSTLTVGNATFPETLAVAINDRAASGGNAAVPSKIALNANLDAETLTMNGKTKGGGKTYGATGSGADVIDDDHFSGTGTLHVKNPCGFMLIVR